MLDWFGSPNALCQIAEIIRGLVDSYTKPVPAVLEIPSKDRCAHWHLCPCSEADTHFSYQEFLLLACRPYDPSKDSILNRVKHLLGGPGGEA